MERSYANPAAEREYRRMLGNLDRFPIAFTYAGKRYSGLGGLLVLERSTQEERREETRIALQLDENLTVELHTAFYPDYGAYEWTVYFCNTGSADSGVLSEVLCADLDFTGARPCLKGILGDHENQYRPYARPVEEKIAFRSESGRPTHVWFPYFNLEHGEGGTLIALGWAGTWEARFLPQEGSVRFQAVSTLDMHTYLKPGESVRTALVALLPYSPREEDYAANLWRRFFIDCNLPRTDGTGAPLQPFSTCCLACDTGLPNSDGSISERYFTWRPSLEKMLAEEIKVDFRWLDAGWYTDPAGNTVPSDWWGTVGSWEIDPQKWPGETLRESTDFGRAHGIKTLMWFEPERITHPAELSEHYGYQQEWGLQTGSTVTSNLGEEDCLQWTGDRIVQAMERAGCDMYREDNNSNPADGWRLLDQREGENRRGMGENRAVVGHYRLWDRIIGYCRENGKCTFVDSCASGGGRNDLESLRRGVPLLRSDADRESTALRLSMTSSFNKWIPFCGANTREKVYQLDAKGVMDRYVWRASYLPILNVEAQFVQDPHTDFDMLRFGIREWNSVKRYLLCEFYLHTPWHSKEERDGWTAFSFFDREDQSGILEAFRMEECPDPEVTVELRYLEETATYSLTDADSGDRQLLSGRELRQGYRISLDKPRSARLLYVERIDG